MRRCKVLALRQIKGVCLLHRLPHQWQLGCLGSRARMLPSRGLPTTAEQANTPLGLWCTAGEPVLDGGWRNKLATPIFQQRVRCMQLRDAANPAAPLLLCRYLAFPWTLPASSWCSISGAASSSSDFCSSAGIVPTALTASTGTCARKQCATKCVSCVVVEQGIPVLDTWNQTTELHKFHRDNGHGYECSHYCFPSAPQAC